MNESFVFYRSFHEAAEGLNDEQYGKIMRLLAEYALNGTEPDEMDAVTKLAFTLMKPQIDANSRRRENGSKGGKPKSSEPNPNQSVTESEPNSNLNVTKAKPNSNQSVTESEPNENANVNANKNANENVNANANELSARVRERFGAFVENVEALTNSPMTEYKKQLVVQKLISFGKTEAEQIALLSEAIENGWHTVYPKKRTDAKRQETKEEFAERWACV